MNYILKKVNAGEPLAALTLNFESSWRLMHLPNLVSIASVIEQLLKLTTNPTEARNVTFKNKRKQPVICVHEQSVVEHTSMCACMHVCLRVYVRACVRASVRAYICACVRAHPLVEQHTISTKLEAIKMYFKSPHRNFTISYLLVLLTWPVRKTRMSPGPSSRCNSITISTT